jgi:hypothetical protein
MTPVLAVDGLAVLVAVETMVLLGVVVLLAGLLRAHATILRRLHELGAGVGDPSGSSTSAPVPFRTTAGVPGPPGREGLPRAADIAGSTLGGDAAAVAVAGTTHDTLLAFLSSTCLTCQRFWEDLRQPGAVRLPGGTRLVVVTKDAAEESPSALAGLAPDGVTVVQSSTAWGAYDVPGSPYFVLVDGPGGQVLGEGTGLDWGQVLNLLGQATADVAAAGAGTGAGLSRAEADAAREALVDAELQAAGIHPGDTSLYRGTLPGTPGRPVAGSLEPPDAAADGSVTRPGS